MKVNIATLIAILSLVLIGCSKTTPPAPGETATETATATDVAPAETPVVEVAETSADPMKNKGIGPIKSVTLEPIDEALAEAGEKVFKVNCTACHKMDKRRVGPPLADITKRRTPEWIMNMIMNPAEMLEKDPIAKELLGEYATQMADQNISETDARAILEYLRTKSTP